MLGPQVRDTSLSLVACREGRDGRRQQSPVARYMAHRRPLIPEAPSHQYMAHPSFEWLRAASRHILDFPFSLSPASNPSANPAGSEHTKEPGGNPSPWCPATTPLQAAVTLLGQSGDLLVGFPGATLAACSSRDDPSASLVMSFLSSEPSTGSLPSQRKSQSVYEDRASAAQRPRLPQVRPLAKFPLATSVPAARLCCSSYGSETLSPPPSANSLCLDGCPAHSLLYLPAKAFPEQSL